MFFTGKVFAPAVETRLNVCPELFDTKAPLVVLTNTYCPEALIDA